jgi:hypothetical protein
MPLPKPPKRTTTENRENYAKDPETQAEVARAKEMRAASLAKKRPKSAPLKLGGESKAPSSPKVGNTSYAKVSECSHLRLVLPIWIIQKVQLCVLMVI